MDKIKFLCGFMSEHLPTRAFSLLGCVCRRGIFFFWQGGANCNWCANMVDILFYFYLTYSYVLVLDRYLKYRSEIRPLILPQWTRTEKNNILYFELILLVRLRPATWFFVPKYKLWIKKKRISVKFFFGEFKMFIYIRCVYRY